MKKLPYFIILLLVIMCIILGSSLATKSNDTIQRCDNNSDEMHTSDFNSSNYINSFDVSDFSGKELNTLDISSLQYTNDTISILNSQFKISDRLLNEIYTTIKDYGANNSFYLISLEDDMSIAYNIDKNYETASSIKAPYALYIYQEIEKGTIDPNQKIVYESQYYNKEQWITIFTSMLYIYEQAIRKLEEFSFPKEIESILKKILENNNEQKLLHKLEIIHSKLQDLEYNLNTNLMLDDFIIKFTNVE